MRSSLKNQTIFVRRRKIVKDAGIVLEIAVQVVPAQGQVVVNEASWFNEIVDRAHREHLVENVLGRSVVCDEIEFRLQVRWDEVMLRSSPECWAPRILSKAA